MDESLTRDSEKIQRLMHRFFQSYGRNMMTSLAQGRINMPQHNTMYVLDEMGEISMGELAGRMGVTMGASTNIVDKLVRAGLAARQRNPKDRRMVTVRLTEKGTATLRQTVGDCRDLLAQIFGHINPGERQRFIEVYEQVSTLSEQHLEANAPQAAAGA